jgi:hypothetical protein
MNRTVLIDTAYWIMLLCALVIILVMILQAIL